MSILVITENPTQSNVAKRTHLQKVSRGNLAASKDEYTDSDVTRTPESCIHVFITQSHIPRPVSHGLRHH